MEKYDVAIVGAGPAGSTCAYEIGKAGKKLALFDHSHPREKPCGGAIPINLLSEFNMPKTAVDMFCNNLILESPSGETIKLHRKAAGATVMRKKFDGFLMKRASKVSDFFDEKVVGVEEKGEGWIVRTDQRQIHTDYLVGADGYPSLVRNRLTGPIDPKHIAHCVGYHIGHRRSHISRHFNKTLEIHFYNLSGAIGYVWIFPKQGNLNVGLGDRLGAKGLRKRLEDFISNEARLTPLRKTFYVHLLPVVHDPKFFDLPTSGKNWALIGDAAGHVNPITGEGIYFGMVDGRLAAQAIISGDMQAYEKEWRAEIGSYFYLGARYQKLFYSQCLLDFVIKKAKKSKELREFLMDLVGSLKPYSELLTYRAAGRWLKIAWQILI